VTKQERGRERRVGRERERIGDIRRQRQVQEEQRGERREEEGEVEEPGLSLCESIISW
jgi:hypothetical protein